MSTTTTDLGGILDAVREILAHVEHLARHLGAVPAPATGPESKGDGDGLFDVEKTPPTAPVALPPHRNRDRRSEYLAEKRRVHRVGKRLVELSHSEVAVLLVLRDVTVEKGLITFDDGVERFLDHFEVNEHARGIARERGRHALSALTQPLRASSANYGDRPVMVQRYPGVLGRAVLELAPEFVDAPKKVPAQQPA